MVVSAVRLDRGTHRLDGLEQRDEGSGRALCSRSRE